MHTEALLTHGEPNRRIGSTQGISNLEVVDSAARIYATWIQKDFGDGKSLLFGLYDLNSEFCATNASGLLIPSLGIGIDFSQSGRNAVGLPEPRLALRAKVQHDGGCYSQFALIDGVPGDPDTPGRTVVGLKRKDGALVVGQYRWQPGWPYRDPAPSLVPTRETTFEVGARWQPWASVAVQPLVQGTWNVGGRPGEHATLVGARIEWSPGAGAGAPRWRALMWASGAGPG